MMKNILVIFAVILVVVGGILGIVVGLNMFAMVLIPFVGKMVALCIIGVIFLLLLSIVLGILMSI